MTSRYSWKNEDVIASVKNSRSLSAAIEELEGRPIAGGRIFAALKQKILELNIDVSHFGKHRKLKPTKSKIKDWAGQKFFHITILDCTFAKSKGGNALWNAQCSCGTKLILIPQHVKRGDRKHCGCQKTIKPAKIRASSQKDIDRAKRWTMNQTPEYIMYQRVRRRALEKGLMFNLDLSDIIIPKYCPVLGMELRVAKGKHMQYESPSLDRIIPELGYTKGNVRVISMRANTLKNNATLAELEAITQDLRNITKQKTFCEEDRSQPILPT
jgi:hypothetical protein